MLRNEVWAQVAEPEAGMLCISCVEERLGRRLGPVDFTWAPINDGPCSERLRSRVLGLEEEFARNRVIRPNGQ